MVNIDPNTTNILGVIIGIIIGILLIILFHFLFNSESPTDQAAEDRYNEQEENNWND